MKMHIGVDDTLGLIHSIDTTAANVHDIVPSGNLLHGGEQRVFGDAGYLGIQKRDDRKQRKDVDWHIAKRPETRKTLSANNLKAEKIKATSVPSGESFPVHQAGFWLQQSPLSRPCEEHQSSALAGSVQQPADRREISTSVGLVRLFSVHRAGNGRKTNKTGRKSA